MKRILSVLSFGALLCALTVSCTKPESKNPIEPVPTGYYILNNGSYGANNSNVAVYDVETKTLTGDVFANVNGKGLGDTAQDILVDGDDVYIAVNVSQIIFVTDKDLKIKKEIVATLADGTKLSPRYFAKGSNGKIYVTYYEGYLGEITPSDYSVRTTATGPNPEGCAYVNGKIFVSNSGGYLYPTYNNTVSVVDATSFVESSTVTVNTNPATMKAYGDNIYILSLGDYGATPAKVQCLNASTLKVTDLDYTSPSAIALSDDTLYVMCGGYDENWNPLPGTVYKHNALTNTAEGTFVTDGTALPQAYSLAATSEYVWVGCSDYKNNGTMYVFTPDGKLFDAISDTEGLNPITVSAR